jgi:hypothetical protein
MLRGEVYRTLVGATVFLVVVTVTVTVFGGEVVGLAVVVFAVVVFAVVGCPGNVGTLVGMLRVVGG